jgi:uncharacterized protein YjbI with pentapeptide repeats
MDEPPHDRIGAEPEKRRDGENLKMAHIGVSVACGLVRSRLLRALLRFPPKASKPAMPPSTRISQQDINTAIALHEKMAKGKTGGTRLTLSFKVAERMDFRNRDLSEAELVGAFLCESTFAHAKMTRANLFGADLTGCDMSDTDLSKADMRGAQLKRANLERANLTSADIRDGFIIVRDKEGNFSYHNNQPQGAVLTDAKFAHADLTQARMSRVFGPRTDLTGCIMRGTILRQADLSNSDLSGVVLTGADLTNANLSNCILHGATLAGALLDNTNLDGADLTASNFGTHDLARADTSKAVLPVSIDKLEKSVQQIFIDHLEWLKTEGRSGLQADFERVNLADLDAPGVNLSAGRLALSILRNAKLAGGYFQVADFSSAFMAGCDLSSAQLQGAKLDKATLTGAQLRDADFAPMPVDTLNQRVWNTKMKEANLSGADLRGANLAKADLTGSILRRADLRDANLADAVLLDCDFSGADLRGAVLTGADTRGTAGLDDAI